MKWFQLHAVRLVEYYKKEVDVLISVPPYFWAQRLHKNVKMVMQTTTGKSPISSSQYQINEFL